MDRGTLNRVLGVALVAVPLVLNRMYESEGRSRVESFSGRTELWQQTLDMIRDRPIQGYGFLSFRDYGPQPFSDIRVVHAHDEWLNLWFTLGLVGVVLAAASYFAFFLQARRDSGGTRKALVKSRLFRALER